MAGEYVFNLNHLTRQYDSLTVLDDITLAFFFGAKIGVIGGNGAGKSSLLKIIAGLDKDYHGECMVAPGVRVGYLPQEPQLDETKDVAGNVAAGAAAAQAILDRYDELCGRLGEARELPGGESKRRHLAIADELLDSVLDAIEGAARTGKIGDGKIFVMPLEQSLRIRTGETGESAL